MTKSQMHTQNICHKKQRDDEPEAFYLAEEISKRVREHILNKTTKELRRTVRKCHPGLGHPAGDAMLRVMKGGGPSHEAMEYARRSNWSVCAACAQPGRPLQSSTRTRPADSTIRSCVT